MTAGHGPRVFFFLLVVVLVLVLGSRRFNGSRARFRFLVLLPLVVPLVIGGMPLPEARQRLSGVRLPDSPS